MAVSKPYIQASRAVSRAYIQPLSVVLDNSILAFMAVSKPYIQAPIALLEHYIRAFMSAPRA